MTNPPPLPTTKKRPSHNSVPTACVFITSH